MAAVGSKRSFPKPFSGVAVEVRAGAYIGGGTPAPGILPIIGVAAGESNGRGLGERVGKRILGGILPPLQVGVPGAHDITAHDDDAGHDQGQQDDIFNAVLAP